MGTPTTIKITAWVTRVTQNGPGVAGKAAELWASLGSGTDPHLVDDPLVGCTFFADSGAGDGTGVSQASSGHYDAVSVDLCSDTQTRIYFYAKNVTPTAVNQYTDGLPPTYTITDGSGGAIAGLHVTPVTVPASVASHNDVQLWGAVDLLLDSAAACAPFVADFDADPRESDTVPLSVDFTDTSFGGTGAPDAWAWDFGDGTTSTEQDPTHVYGSPGSYTVTLTVTTDDAETDTRVRTDFIVIGLVHVDPPPSNAVVEIYAASTGSARWGVALWGVATWATAGWQDVTPESVDAIIRWGSHTPAKGLLTETEAATWIVDTYDPERLLDPGNADSPYSADLRAGLPIRVRHRGTIVRQGVAESIAYYHANHRGGIRVTDNLSLMARTPVPSDSDLADTLRARARDAIAAAGLRVTVEDDPPGGDPALAPRLDGDRSVWRHIADAAQQTLHIAYVDRIGTLKFRPWSAPYDRGRGVDETQMVDLGVIVQTTGLYSVVSARQTVGDGGDLIERRLTPTPRYGAVAYIRDDATPDAGDWAGAVLADRSLQTVQWIPGAIFPLDADAVEYFATLEALERFGVDDDRVTPAVDVTGIIVGGQVSVIGKRDAEATWSFSLELAQTATSPLYTDTDPAEFLLNEAGDGYLFGD